MRLGSAFLLVAVGAVPASAIELIELKNGKILKVEDASRVGGKLHVRLALPAGAYAATTIPIDRVVPEFVFYVWAEGLAAGDKGAHVELAEWSRRNGLFRHALKVYDAMARFDDETRAALPALIESLREDEALWLCERAEALLKADEARDARVVATMVLDDFKGSKHGARALEIALRIDERLAQLTAERLREEREARLRRQRIEVKTQVARIAQGDAWAASANLRYVGEARWRLNWAGQLYEGAAASLIGLLPFVEDEGLRKEMEGHIQAADTRMAGAFLRLADLRYLCGDFGAALDAAHRVLSIDPDNTGAAGIRDRILDGPGPTHIRRDGGFLTYRKDRSGFGGYTGWRWRR
jgi:hypothetical protein